MAIQALRCPRDRGKSTDRLGHDHFYAVLDDHSRLAYGELLPDETAPTVTAFVRRALAWFDGNGIQCRRLMTHGAWSYTRNRDPRQLLTQHETVRELTNEGGCTAA